MFQKTKTEYKTILFQKPEKETCFILEMMNWNEINFGRKIIIIIFIEVAKHETLCSEVSSKKLL